MGESDLQACFEYHAEKFQVALLKPFKGEAEITA